MGDCCSAETDLQSVDINTQSREEDALTDNEKNIISHRFKIKEIDSVDDLKDSLQNAMIVEMTALNLYLTAYFSFLPQNRQQSIKNAKDLLLSIIMDQMKHMAILSNIMVSLFGTNDKIIGCQYNIDFSETSNIFPCNIRRDIKKMDEKSLTLLNLCSKEQIFDIFMKIEEPDGHSQVLSRRSTKNMNRFFPSNRNDSVKISFRKTTNEVTILDFYNHIIDGLKELSACGDITFHYSTKKSLKKTSMSSTSMSMSNVSIDSITGDITEMNNSNYSNDHDSNNNNNNNDDLYQQCHAFKLKAITCLEDAINGINKIKKTRESIDDGIYTRQEDLSHYVRFVQLLVGKDVIFVKKENDENDKQLINYTFKYGQELKYYFTLNDLYPSSNFKIEAKESKFDYYYEKLLKNLTQELKQGSMRKGTNDMLQLQRHFVDCMNLRKFPLWKTNFKSVESN